MSVTVSPITDSAIDVAEAGLIGASTNIKHQAAKPGDHTFGRTRLIVASTRSPDAIELADIPASRVMTPSAASTDRIEC
jgi:hypothetical protein